MRRRASAIQTPQPISYTSLYDVLDTHPRGELVEFRERLKSCEERLYEQTVGMIIDTRAATAGNLYEFRERIRIVSS